MNRFLPLASLILMTAACSRQEAPLAATGAQPTAVAVQVESVAASEIADIYRASGTVRARYTAAIAAKIAANNLEIRVQAGDRVQADQVLIMLDRRDLEAHLRRSEAARAEAESAIAETENAIAAARQPRAGARDPQALPGPAGQDVCFAAGIRRVATRPRPDR